MIYCRTILIFLSSALLSTAATQPWEKAAITFVSDAIEARAENFDIKQTGVSTFTTKGRRKELADKWHGFLNYWSFSKIKASSVGEIRRGDLAAVLVRLENLNNPLEVQVTAVGLQRVEGDWKVGPALGSLKNLTLGFDKETSRKTTEIELWIEKEQSRALNKAVSASQDVLFQAIAAEEKQGDIHAENPLVAASRFASLCHERSLSGVLAYLGGIDRPLPEDWESRLQQTLQEFHNMSGASPGWSALMSPYFKAFPIDVDQEGEYALVTLATYDPTISGARYYKVDMERYEDNWRVDLPKDFDYLRVSDAKELDGKFMQGFFKSYPNKGFDDLDGLAGYLNQALDRQSFWEMATCLTPKASKPLGLQQFRLLARFWEKQTDGSELSAAPIFFPIQDKDQGAIIYASSDVNRPGDITLNPVFTTQVSDKWYISEAVDVANFEARALFKGKKAQLKEKAADQLLKNVVTLENPPTEGAPKKEAAETLVRQYREALVDVNPSESYFKYLVRFSGTGTALMAYQNLVYARRGALSRKVESEILGAYQEGAVTAVSLRIPGAKTNPSEDLLYLVIQTAEGPRLICDIDLRYPRNTARETLNGRVWKRLDAVAPEGFMSSLRALYAQHEELVRARDELDEKAAKEKATAKEEE